MCPAPHFLSEQSTGPQSACRAPLRLGPQYRSANRCPRIGGTLQNVGGASLWSHPAIGLAGCSSSLSLSFSLCPGRPRPLTALLFFLPRLSLDRDECLLGTHACSRRQFCVNTLGSFYCVNHTVLCAQGFILNVHRKCVGKRAPRPARLHAPRPPSRHVPRGLPAACVRPVGRRLRSVSRAPRRVLVSCHAAPPTPPVPASQDSLRDAGSPGSLQGGQACGCRRGQGPQAGRVF